MLPKLKNSKKYKDDLDKFTKGISKMPNAKAQKDYEKLLKEFKQLCNVIDDSHSAEYNGYVKPDLIKEKIFSMVSVRKKLQKYLNDAESLN